MTPAEFIKKYSNIIVETCIGTGIFPSVKMAQMALETGWGKSIVGNNLFGIKARGNYTPFWKGAKIYADTTEYISGSYGNYNEPFRNYATQADSVKDHTYFLQNNKRYSKVFTADTPEQQAKELQAAGYATDPNYANKLISIINKYNLKTLDQKKK